MITVALAGSSGSVGAQAVDVVRANPDRFTVTAIGAYSSVDTLVDQANELRPKVVAIVDPASAVALEPRLPVGTELRVGPDAMASIATEADVTVNGVTGFAGLPVTLATLNAGRRLALANKESLITAGPLVHAARRTKGADLIPVDSEHGALHQCLRAEGHHGAADGKAVERLIVTATGGPFRGRTLDDLAGVTVEEALAHPVWSMGRFITVASSTLFNKGLEVIEAHELFGIDYDRIEVVVHPQAIIHSAVEFTDGSTIAQLSRPDMRLPIGYAMGYPDRLATPYGALDWAAIGALTFEGPDLRTFRCLALAYEAGRAGGTAPTWLNAANEVATQAFLDGKLPWLGIAAVVEETVAGWDGMDVSSVDVVMEADAEARRRADRAVQQRILEV